MSHRFTPPPSSTLTVLTLLAIGPCSPAWAADGGIDLGFGTNGIVSTPINTRALAIQADGRIVVVGDANGDFGVVRYNGDGSLDVTFGQGGIVHTDLGGNDAARAVVVSADGTILVGGTGLVRYNPNGSLDAGFGTGGLVTGVPADDIAIRPDGTIMTVGSQRVTHLNSQGDVEFTAVLPPIKPCADPPALCGFGFGGITDYDIMPNGQIVAAGYNPSASGNMFFVARYDENGTPDTTFGTAGGTATWIGYEWESAFAVAAQDDGKIVAAGYSQLVQYLPPLHWYTSVAVGRVNSDGTLDRTFGGRGGVLTAPECLPLSVLCRSSAATAVALQRDGKILAVGTIQRTLGTNELNLVLARYQPDGTRDPGFGTDGIVITDVSPQRPAPRDVQIQRDGKILVAGGGIVVRYLGTSAEDDDAPVIECDEPDGIWHAANVTLTCTATDSGSGLANAEADTHFTLRTSVAVGDEWPNAFTDSRQICDNSGHCATAGPIGGNRIDLRPPTVAVTAPAAGSTFTLGQQVNADYACHDAGSGMQSCRGTVPSGTPANTSSVGRHTFEVTGLDAVGNSAQATSSYTVSYGMCPRYDASRPKNSGSTVPIKLQLCDASGANVSASAIVVTALHVVRLSGSGEGSLDDSGHANAGLEFRFSGGQYILNLGLKGFAPGTYGLQLKAGNDPAMHTVQFEVR